MSTRKPQEKVALLGSHETTQRSNIISFCNMYVIWMWVRERTCSCISRIELVEFLNVKCIEVILCSCMLYVKGNLKRKIYMFQKSWLTFKIVVCSPTTLLSQLKILDFYSCKTWQNLFCFQLQRRRWIWGFQKIEEGTM